MIDSQKAMTADSVQYGFKPQADGTVLLILSRGSGDHLQLSIRIEDLAGFTAAALQSARLASELSGKVPSDVSTLETNLSGASPDRIGIALGPASEQVSLVAHYGAAMLALPFKKGEATQIGQALLTAGAGSTGAH